MAHPVFWSCVLFLLSLVHGPDSSAWSLSPCDPQPLFLLDLKPNPEQPIDSQRWAFPFLRAVRHICMSGQSTAPQDILDLNMAVLTCLTFFFFPCRTSVRIPRFVMLGHHHHGSARKYFRVIVMLQLQATLEPNWAAIPRPTVPSVRRTWTICSKAALITSSCCQMSGYIRAEWHVCLNIQQSLLCTYTGHVANW